MGYLSGATLTIQMPDGSVQAFGAITPELDFALKNGKLLSGGTVSIFADGWLVDGCPLNVIFGQGWLPGQQEALRAAGLTRCLPAPAVANNPQGPSAPVINAPLAAGYQNTGAPVAKLVTKTVTSSSSATPAAPIILNPAPVDWGFTTGADGTQAAGLPVWAMVGLGLGALLLLKGGK